MALRKNKLPLLVGLYFLISLEAYAFDIDGDCQQTALSKNPDSLLAAAEKAIQNENYFCAKNYTDELLKDKKYIQKASANQVFTIHIYHAVSNLYNGDFVAAVEDVDECSKWIDENKQIPSNSKYRLKLLEGELMMELHDYRLAYELYKAAFDIVSEAKAEGNHDKDYYYMLALAKTNMGYALSNFHDPKEPHGPLNEILDTLNLSIKNHRKALRYLDLIQKNNKNINPDYDRKIERIRAYIHFHLSHVYYKKAYLCYFSNAGKLFDSTKVNVDSAISYIEYAIGKSKNYNWNRLLSFSLLLKGDILFDLPGLRGENNDLVKDLINARDLYEETFDVVQNNEQGFSVNVYVLAQLQSRFENKKKDYVKRLVQDKLLREKQNGNNQYSSIIRNSIIKDKEWTEKNKNLKDEIENNKDKEVEKKTEESRKSILIWTLLTLLTFFTFAYMYTIYRNKHDKIRDDKLKRENNHRIKNNLQMLASSMKIQLRDKSVKDNLIATEALKTAIAKVQSILELHKILETNNKEKGKIPFNLQTYFNQLTHSLFEEVFEQTDVKYEVNVSTVADSISVTVARELGMAITELIQNAKKYAAPEFPIFFKVLSDNKGGKLEINLTNTVAKEHQDIPKAKQNSTGLTIIKAIAEKLGGTFHFTTFREESNNLSALAHLEFSIDKLKNIQ